MAAWYRKWDVRAGCQAALIVLLISLLVFPPGLMAQTSSAWNGGSGFYENASSWSPAGVPDNANAGGPFDVTVNSGVGDDVTLRFGGVNLNSMTIGGSGAGSTVSIASNNLGLTLGTTYNSALNISGDGTLNINSGSSALVLGNNGGGITNNGTLNIAGGATLTVQGEFLGAFITNNGVIALGDLNGGGTLVLNDSGRGAPFLLTNDFGSTGVLRMSDNAANRINGVSGGESLFIENGSTISGAGSINVAVSNGGTLLADGANALIVNGNLTNWNGADTITGGIYGASSTLQLSSMGGNSIQTLSGAVVNLGGAGKISGNGTNNALTGLANINNSVLGLSGMSGPVTITPTGGTLTLSSDSNNTAMLTTEFGTQATVNGAFHNLANSDFGTASSTVNVSLGGTFTTGAFTNEANVTQNFWPANAVVNVNSGGTLNVGALTTSTNNGYASSIITIDGGTLNASSITQGSGPGLQSGASNITLTNGSIGTVTGDFNNISELNATTVTLDNASHLTIGGAFTQSQPDGSGGQGFLILDHGSSMNAGSLTNSTGVQSNGVPQSHVSVNNGSTLTVGAFGNVDANGVLSGGDYYVGPASAFNYTGAAITKIDTGTSVTLDATGKIKTGGSDAINNSLTTNNGSLTLKNGANLSLRALTNIDANGVLSGGSFEIDDGSTLRYQGVDVTSIDSALTLGGSGKLISGSGQPDALSTSLKTVNGSLTLQNSANLTLAFSAGSFQNNGTVRVLSNSTFDTTNTWFKNVDSNGFLNGNFEIGDGSTLLYNSGLANIYVIGSDASLTLGSGARILNTAISGNQDALQSLISNFGNLTLNGGSISSSQQFNNYGTLTAGSGNSLLDISATSGLTNAQPPSGQLPIRDLQVTGADGFPGTMNVNDGATLTIQDTSGSGFSRIENDGVINLLGDQAATTLAFNSGGNAQKFLLAGNGTLYLQDSSGELANNYIAGVSGAESLINGYNHTIEGSGTISNFASFKNNGLLELDGYQGLTIDLTNGGTFTNDGRGNAVVDVLSDNLLQINSNSNTSITNNGTINLIGCGCGAGAALVLNDNGNGATFTFTGNARSS